MVMLARGLATKQIARQPFSEHLLESMTANIAHAPVAAAP